MTDRPSQCEHCGRDFAEQNSLYQHMKAKHPKAKRAHLRPAREPEEMSLAEELVEAKIAHACGEPVPDHLLAMFPEEFEATP